MLLVFNFLLAYIPWWSVFLILICFPFLAVYWSKDAMREVFILASLMTISFIAIAWYIHAGSPDASIRLFWEFIDSISFF